MRSQGEPEVDAIGGEHRQIQGNEAGVLFQLVEDLSQVLTVASMMPP